MQCLGRHLLAYLLPDTVQRAKGHRNFPGGHLDRRQCVGHPKHGVAAGMGNEPGRNPQAAVASLQLGGLPGAPAGHGIRAVGLRRGGLRGRPRCGVCRGHPKETGFRFGKNEFFCPELEPINRCAYSDYQRDKVYLRTSPAVRESLRRKQRADKRKLKVNEEVKCGSRRNARSAGTAGLRLPVRVRTAKW